MPPRASRRWSPETEHGHLRDLHDRGRQLSLRHDELPRDVHKRRHVPGHALRRDYGRRVVCGDPYGSRWEPAGLWPISHRRCGCRRARRRASGAGYRHGQHLSARGLRHRRQRPLLGGARLTYHLIGGLPRHAAHGDAARKPRRSDLPEPWHAFRGRPPLAGLALARGHPHRRPDPRQLYGKLHDRRDQYRDRRPGGAVAHGRSGCLHRHQRALQSCLFR